MELKTDIRNKIFIFLVVIVHSTYLQANKISNDTMYVFTERYEGIIFGKNFPINLIDNKKNRWNPSREDVEQAELLLQAFVIKQAKKKGLVNQVGDCPVIHASMNKYLRQYIGTINEKGDKILEINFLWKYGIFPEWKTHLIKVLDGCSFYWSVKVNLSKKKCFDYLINGF